MYTNTITLVVPLSVLETAKRVSRALDPDSGGYEAFQARAIKEGKEYALYSSPCTASFAANASLFIYVPEELYAVVAEDYASRWSELECPSIEEIVQFCASVECYIDTQPEGLEPVVENQML